MDSIEQANHFQKTFTPILAGLLAGMDLPLEGHDVRDLTEKAFCRSNTLSCTGKLDEGYDENLADKITCQFKIDERYKEALKQKIREARWMAKKAVLDAPYRMVSDFREAAAHMNAFAADTERRSVMFGVDTGHAKKHYAVFKLPYSERVDFFYGTTFEGYLGPLYPERDMKYLGFIDRKSGVLYDLREPMDMCWFDKPHGGVNSESGGELRNSIKRAIQKEVARRVAENAPPIPDAPLPGELLGLFGKVEAEYGSGVTVPDFADKVTDTHLYIHTDDPVRFITEQETLISERADEYLKQYGSEMERRWIAHAAAQKMFSYTASLGAAARQGDEAVS